MDMQEFDALVADGTVDTVVCVAPDPYGRTVGKRLTVDAFNRMCRDGDGFNASSFIFAVDLEMNPLELPVSNSENGWSDIRLVPDFETMRHVPWEPNCALVICDAYVSTSDTPVAVSPRAILKDQIRRGEDAGFTCSFASELEFFLSSTPPREAWDRGYENLQMTSDYRSDYQMGQAARDDWFISKVRSMMPQFGVPIESSKPEWGLGQHEITLDYCPTLEMADRHLLFKYGVKQLAHQHGMTATFMAKPDIDEVGSSCHLHISMWDAAEPTRPLGWDDEGEGQVNMSRIFGSFVAGLMEHAADSTLMFAPTVNSYKRFLPGQFAGTAIALGSDNRSCAFRLVGSGAGFRVENRIPGGDVNPYYAYAATIAAGVDGVRRQLPTPTVHSGNAWNSADTVETVPTSLHSAVDRFATNRMLAEAFGGDVHRHLLESARKEVESFDSGTVTDWEKKRYYERV